MTDSPAPRRHSVRWLVALVATLALAVAAAGGYLLAQMAERTAAADPAEAAIAKWERAVNAAPDDPSALTALGYAYQEAGRYEDALSAYDRALAVDQGDLAAAYNRAVVLAELGRAQEAEAGLLAVLKRAPDHVLAAKRLGERYVREGRYAEALKVLAPALASNPRYADMQYLAGYACEQLGRTEEAALHYREALRYSPDMVKAEDGLGRLGEGVDPE